MIKSKRVLVVLLAVLALTLVGCGKKNALSKVEGKTPTCMEVGHKEYYLNSKTLQYYLDSEGKNEVNLNGLFIDKLGHSFDYKGDCERCSYSNLSRTVNNEDSGFQEVIYENIDAKIGDQLHIYGTVPTDFIGTAAVLYYIDEIGIRNARSLVATKAYFENGQQITAITNSQFNTFSAYNKADFYFSIVFIENFTGNLSVCFEI